MKRRRERCFSDIMDDMPPFLLWGFVFLAGLALLVKSSDWFTDAAVAVGLRFGLPPFIVGVTIVAIGTSLPELSSSIAAVVSGATEIVAANVIGSNITNVFLILGVGALIGKAVTIEHNLLDIELPIFLASALLLAVMAWDGAFTLFEGVLTTLAFATYLFYSASTRERRAKGKTERTRLDILPDGTRFSWRSVAVLIVSGALIFIGAKYTVDSVVALANIIGISTAIISVTAVALGTSLPELAVTVSGARKGKLELVVGNVLGSNIFNALAVTGISAFFGNLAVPATMVSFGLPMMIVASVLLFVMTHERRVSVWEGIFLLLFYVFFLVRSVTIG